MYRDLQIETLEPRRIRARQWIWLAALAGLLSLARSGGAAEPGLGLMIESVVPFSAPALSGLEPGDRLLSWTFRPREPMQVRPQRGSLASPFDLFELLIETAPRGELILEGWRQDRFVSWTYRSMGGLVLGLQVRPMMEAVPAGSPRLAAWCRLRDAVAADSAGRVEAADRAFREASEILDRASDAFARAVVLWAWADRYIARRDHARGRELLEEALELVRRRDGAEFSVAFTLGFLAFLSDGEGDLAASERIWLERLAVLEKLAPQSMEAARTLDFLGYLALWRGDTAAAQERLVRSEAIQRPIAPRTLHYAATLNKLALLAVDLGDLERAEALQRRVVALNEQLVPGSQEHGGSLMNLAMIRILRGEFALAEDLLRRSVELMGKPGKDPLGAAGPTANLGMLALRRGDLAAAQSYLELALSLMGKAPESVELADVYSALAEMARKQRRFAQARAWEKSALAIAERLALGGFGQAGRLQALARIELEGGGDLAAAERLLRDAERLARAAAPESPRVNSILRDLGRLLARTDRLAEAESLYRRVLSHLERRGFTGTKDEAEIFNLLGSVQRRRGDLAAAGESLCRATRILDLQRSRLGGSLESRGWFESETQSYSFDCLSALLELGRSAEAFHALERGKTQVFLQLLAERDLRLMGLPPELRAERARLGAEYDRVLSRLSGLGAERVVEIASLRARLEEIKAARESLIARLRLASPRLAALQAPAPLDLAEARRALDPGTALLAYAVGPQESYLFVVHPSDEGGRGLEVHRLPAGRATLEKQIETYRRLLTDPRSHLATLNAGAARLYGLLVKPAEKGLARARRILISADGPLHMLPWAALRRRDRYLAHWRPIHLIASTTVYAETRRGRRRAGDPATWRLVAFGDPRYPEVSGAVGETFADSEVRSVLRRGVKLEPLPATRDEVREIAELFPGARIYLGDEATEDRAKQAAPEADLLHFAGHGLVDERFPLDSALALTIPSELEEGRDNGLLQAWEIFEEVRLDAHLVTLSACETALGSEMGGEGLLGLTRAFQFAGASTVLASLWNVSDASTTALMKRFYSYLRQDRTKDEALGAAQLDLIRSGRGDLAHPYHWAGFSLYGDWR